MVRCRTMVAVPASPVPSDGRLSGVLTIPLAAGIILPRPHGRLAGAPLDGELTSQRAVVGASWARLGAEWAQNGANSRTAVSKAEK